MSKRKLPLPEVVKRHYWFEGLSQKAIGELYGVGATAVKKYMDRHDIPTRTATAWNRITTTECIECGAPVCFWKHWRRRSAKYVWALTKRCEVHQADYIRKSVREAKRRFSQTEPSAFRPHRYKEGVGKRKDIRTDPP